MTILEYILLIVLVIVWVMGGDILSAIDEAENKEISSQRSAKVVIYGLWPFFALAVYFNIFIQEPFRWYLLSRRVRKNQKRRRKELKRAYKETR